MKLKLFKWVIGTVILLGILGLVIARRIPFVTSPDTAYPGFLSRILYIIVLACFLCLYRICRGPTGADRIVAIDILGIMIVGLCALLTISTGRSWYMDIGIAWALQSFISTLALSKYLEGRSFDE